MSLRHATAGKPFTPQVLVRDFGLRSIAARQAVSCLHNAVVSTHGDALAGWRRRCGGVDDRGIDRFTSYSDTLARRFQIAAAETNPPALWFAMQTYYAALVGLLARRFVSWTIDDLPGGNPFRWCFSANSREVEQSLEPLVDVLGMYDAASLAEHAQSEGDLLKALYQDLFPRPLRHRLGEYYTPDWLARHVLDQVGFCGERGQRLLDPACGSGTFLVLALQRARAAQCGSGKWETKGLGIRDWGLDKEARGEGPEMQNADCEMQNEKCRMQNEKREESDATSLATGHWPLTTSPNPQFTIVGCDINPLAVLTARANYVIALHDWLPKDTPVEIPVYLADSVLERPPQPAFDEPFDVVVGNPPWIAWDNLSPEYRQASLPSWQRYGLFSLSANDARHGGGKKDLSMLMLYTAADRYLKSAGRLGMVITQTLFQTKGAGDGFRHFRLGPDGEPLKVLRVDDMVALRPFGDAANWTSVVVMQKGEETDYPVPYYRWGLGTRDGRRGTGDVEQQDDRRIPKREPPFSRDPKGSGQQTSAQSDSKFDFQIQSCVARPIDPARPSSPWLVRPIGRCVDPESESDLSCGGRSDYAAHLGANSGGANGVYWLEVLGQADGGVWVRNVAAKSKHGVEMVEQVIEPDLLYPLVRWSDVSRYAAVPRCHVLLAQDVATRTGIDEQRMREKCPRTLAYLERFRDMLTTRAAYRRYQQRGPFYSMYNVGPYTISPTKVVWRRMDRRINAAVVEMVTDPLLGSRPVVPQETCVLVACDSATEAHYLCALLNSDPINELVAAHSVRNGKGFGTPSMLDYLGLRRFDPSDPRHQELAAQSRRAHAAAKES